MLFSKLAKSLLESKEYKKETDKEDNKTLEQRAIDDKNKPVVQKEQNMLRKNGSLTQKEETTVAKYARNARETGDLIAAMHLLDTERKIKARQDADNKKHKVLFAEPNLALAKAGNTGAER